MPSIFFDLNLRDALSRALPKVAATARSVFGDVDKTVQKTQKNMDALGSRDYRLKVDTSGLESASKEVDNLNRKMSSMGGGMGGNGGGGAWGMFKGSFFGSLASRGVEQGMGMVRDVAQQALTAGMDAEQQIIGLSTFVGKDRAKSLYAELQKKSALTPFTTADIMPNMMQLIASGQTEQRAQKDVWSLMNALSATGNAGNPFMMQLMGTHLASAAAQGHLDGRILMEFQRTAHIPIERLIANDMFPNLPAKQGMKKVHDMDVISYDQLTSALERASKAGGMFAGALEAQSQTIRGKWSTIKDWWNIGMAKAVLNPKTHDNITALEDKIIKGLEGFPDLIEKMSPVINKLFDEFNELWPSVRGLGGALLDMLKPIGSFFMSEDFKNAFKGISDFGKELAEDLTPLVKELAQGLKGLAWILTPHGANEKKPGADVQSYVFSDTTGFGAKGLQVDLAQKNKIKDSLETPLFGKGKVFNSYREFLNYQNEHRDVMGKRAGSAMSIGLPTMATTPAPGKNTSATGTAADAASDAIMNGGGRPITINAHFMEHAINHFSNVKEGAKEIMAEFKEEYYRMLLGIPGMQ